MPIQWVNDQVQIYDIVITFRKININDEITVISSGEKAKVRKILTPDGNAEFSLENHSNHFQIKKQTF